MTQYILAFDQGTTSSRAIIFDRQGQFTVLGVPVVRPKITETTALGGAYQLATGSR